MNTKKWLEHYTAHPQDFDDMINLAESTIIKQASKIEELTAHNAAMEEDAVNNTATIKMLIAQLAEQVEENRGMRIQLGWSPK